MAKKKSQSKTQDRTALEQNQTADVAWLSNQWQDHPVVSLTPIPLYSLLTDAEQANLQAQADLFCDMEERDGHIFSEMDKRKKGINGLSWGVNPPKNSSEAERKFAEEIAEWIDDIKDFEMFLFDAMDGVGHGYSCQEIEWHQLGSLWLPKNFGHINTRNFITAYNHPNELRLNDGSPNGAEFGTSAGLFIDIKRSLVILPVQVYIVYLHEAIEIPNGTQITARIINSSGREIAMCEVILCDQTIIKGGIVLNVDEAITAN